MKKSERLVLNEIIESLNEVYDDLKDDIEEYEGTYEHSKRYDYEPDFWVFYESVNDSKSQLKKAVNKLLAEVNKK